MPHAFMGWERSVQLRVSWLHDVVVNPRIPMPDRMFQVATLKTRAAFCPWAAAGLAAGLRASDLSPAPATAANAIARTHNFIPRIVPAVGSKIASTAEARSTHVERDALDGGVGFTFPTR